MTLGAKLPRAAGRMTGHGSAAVVMVVLCSITGCAATLKVVPLATADVAVAAYELRGDDVARLRDEAARLCGGEADVLRESYAAQSRPAPDSGRISAWLHTASQWVDPPNRQAQLMVRCAGNPERTRLSAGEHRTADAAHLPVATETARDGWGLWSGLSRAWALVFGARSTKTGRAVDAEVPYGY